MLSKQRPRILTQSPHASPLHYDDVQIFKKTYPKMERKIILAGNAYTHTNFKEPTNKNNTNVRRIHI